MACTGTTSVKMNRKTECLVAKELELAERIGGQRSRDETQMTVLMEHDRAVGD